MKTLALIGVGRWGKNIVSTFEKIPSARLKYLCTFNLESLKSFTDSYEKVSDWRELLQKSDIDAVIIATPPSTHAEIGTTFLRKGISVFVEKPMVLDVSDAGRLKAIVKESGKVFMVGYQYLFNDNVAYLKKEIERGSFGRILEVTNEHVLSSSRPDVDIFWDEASHPLSIFQHLFNPQKLVSAEGEIQHNSASVHVTFEDAPPLQIIASCFGPSKIRKMTLRGEKGSAVIDETLERKKLAVVKDGKTSYPEISPRQPLRNELEHFLHCLETGEAPLSDVDFGCRITEWLEAISARLK